MSVNARLVRSSSARRPILPWLSRQSRPRLKIFRAVVCAAALLGAASLAPSAPEPTPVPKSRIYTCSFSNPGYSGFCNETQRVPAGSAPNRVCSVVLRCLNDVRCVETYCRATQIRGGWKLAAIHPGVWPPAR